MATGTASKEEVVLDSKLLTISILALFFRRSDHLIYIRHRNHNADFMQLFPMGVHTRQVD